MALGMVWFSQEELHQIEAALVTHDEAYDLPEEAQASLLRALDKIRGALARGYGGVS